MMAMAQNESVGRVKYQLLEVSFFLFPRFIMFLFPENVSTMWATSQKRRVILHFIDSFARWHSLHFLMSRQNKMFRILMLFSSFDQSEEPVKVEVRRTKPKLL
jgi:hypothetical protein